MIMNSGYDESIWKEVYREFSSERYFQGTVFRNKKIINEFVKFVKPEDGPILDVGAYRGYNSFTLNLMGYCVNAIDVLTVINEHSIALHYTKRNIPFRSYKVGQGQRIPADAESYAGALVVEVLEHLQVNPMYLFFELERVLLPGGYVILTTPNQVRLRGRIKVLFGHSMNDDCSSFFKKFDSHKYFDDTGYHWKLYTLHEVKKLAVAAGLQVVSAKYQWMPVASQGSFVELMIRNIERTIGIGIPSCRDWLVFIIRKKKSYYTGN
ncbi:MAG: class I SAM-dependent methyltransferase [Deltaproteobacteria bacterium]|nr:class I SAM-dependent methyltransferase [Deltaproteobacteria bacterium]